MTHDIRFSEDEIACVVGYARVKGDPSRRPRGEKARTPRRLTRASLPRLRSGTPRVAFA